jgi:tetratricopeptide (TPR) repeat protein
VISVFVLAAFGLIAYAIVSYQSNSTFQATLADARRGLRENPAAAATILTKAIASQPGNARGYFYRGIAYGAAGEYEKSIQDLDNAFMKGEEFKLVELAKAASACRASKYVEAIASCEAVLRRDPNNSQAKSLKKLSEDLEKAAQPPSVVATPNSDSAEGSAKKEEPVTHKVVPLDKSIIADALPKHTKLPSDPKKLIQMGYEALRSGDRDDAVDLFTEAVKHAPNDSDARRYLAHSLAEQGSAAAAASQFSALVSLGGLTPRDALKYAEVLQSLNKEDSAREMLAHFVETNPNDLNIRVELLRLYSDAGMKDRATALYNSSLPLATTEAARAALDEARGADADAATIRIRRR